MIPVLLGFAWAYAGGAFYFFPAIVCLSFALLIQIGTNFANDYYDFVKGADTDERMGPSRAVASGWITPGAMRMATGLTMFAAFLAGCLLIPIGGWWLLIVGVLSILCGIAYTGGPYPLGYNGLGDVFVFIFFGLIATAFSYHLQTLEWSRGAWILGVIPGALATSLLVVNNLRDVETDTAAGKRTLIVRYGVRFGSVEYAFMFCLALFSSLALAILAEDWRLLLPWLLTPWGARICVRLTRAQGRSRQHWDRLLQSTAMLLVAFGLLQFIGILLSAWN
jgi:1,4-dihydroxy-2-naphthoate octaprenyltransferase|tara:strand:- start:183689 stop:184525 length:837 start_codon:yes stop_codon:yes gene_type:complete